MHGKRVILSYGLGARISVNSFNDFSTIKSEKRTFDFDLDVPVENGLSLIFHSSIKLQNTGCRYVFYFLLLILSYLLPGTTLSTTSRIMDVNDINSHLLLSTPLITFETSQAGTVVQTNTCGCIRQDVDSSHIK